MKLFYITLNNAEKARAISRDLIKNRLAACTNSFKIESAYIWEGELNEESEVVLIVKTQSATLIEIESIVKKHIDYTNCIAEILVNNVNPGYQQWLDSL